MAAARLKMRAAGCTGDGDCLDQLNDLTYKVNKACVHRCIPVDCPNRIVCGQEGPRSILNCNWGLCTNCAIHHGNLIISEMPDAEKCFVCLSTSKTVVEMPAGCGHQVCVRCFQKFFYCKEKGACPMCCKSKTGIGRGGSGSSGRIGKPRLLD
jgi:hypothetical protein